MNRLLSFFLATPVFLFGQYLLNTNQNTLVNSSQIGADLLLFVPDSAVQILRNPARAADYSNRFIYITHTGFKYYQMNYNIDFYDYPVEYFEYDTRLPKSQTQSVIISNEIPTLSGAYLFGKSNKKWLFRFSNGVDNRDDSREDLSDITADDIEDRRFYSHKYQSKYNVSFNEFSLYKISKSSNYNVAYGLFAGLDIYSRILSDKRYDNRNHLSGLNFYNRVTDRTYVNDRKNNKYFSGIGFSMSNKNWDFIARTTYQKTDFKIERTDNRYNINTDSLFIDPHERTYYSRTIVQTKSTQNGKPDVFHLDLYFRSRLKGLFENDNYFLRLNGFYASETQNFTYSGLSSYVNYRSDTLFITEGDTSQSAGKNDLENYSVGFTAGYIIPYKLIDIHIVSGVIFSTNYSSNESIILNNTNRYRNHYASVDAKENITLKKVRLKFPLYFNYAPNNWLELYGGLNFHLEYEKLVKDGKRDSADDIEEGSYNQNKVTLHSFRSTYLGLNLKHKSGLRIQLAFNNDFTHFQYWNFSLGYIF